MPHFTIEYSANLEGRVDMGAVVELGVHLEVPMPYTRTVYSCTKLLAQRRAEGASDKG